MRKLFALILLLLSATAMAYTCQYDDMQLVWTGQVKTEWGKLVKLYKCPAGHAYWIAE